MDWATGEQKKTGALLRASVKMGGIYAGADRDQLDALSRFGETPEQQLIELADEGYRSLGEPGDVATEQERLDIIAAMPTEKKNALAIEALCDATDMSRAQLQRRLDELLNDGKIRKTGKGRKGDAFRYFLD